MNVVARINKKKGRRSVACAPFVQLVCSYATAHVSISGVLREEDSDTLPYAIGIKRASQSISTIMVED